MPTTESLRAQAERLRRQADRNLEAADRADARADRLANLTEPDVGTVLRWDYTFQASSGTHHVSSRVYEYAALRCSNGLWYTTGPRGGEVPRHWDDLIAFILDGLDGDLLSVTLNPQPDCVVLGSPFFLQHTGRSLATVQAIANGDLP